MNFKSRIKSVERKSGATEKPEVLVFHTVYEDRDGGVGSECWIASVIGANGVCTAVRSEQGDTHEDFDARLARVCMEKFGYQPGNEGH